MKRKITPYKPYLKALARKLRNESTLGEVILWQHLNRKKMFGFDFHRQKPLLDYIADFYCAELNLIIEIDGVSHDNDECFQKDIARDNELAKYQLNVLRFTEREVKYDLINVLRAIESYITARHPNL